MNKKVLSSLIKDPSKIDCLESLMSATLKANEKFNLTAIKEEEKFRELMILDSLLVLNHVSLDNKTILDVGTGAGFPGLPLAISSKGDFTLIDSTSKKINFINEFIKDNEITNVTAISARAEDFAVASREKFDFVIARAVASLPILLELCIPMVKVGGYFIAMKSNKTDEEIKMSANALKKLNASIENIFVDELPESKEKRTLILIKKLGVTNTKYPRSYNLIKNKTL